MSDDYPTYARSKSARAVLRDWALVDEMILRATAVRDELERNDLIPLRCVSGLAEECRCVACVAYRSAVMLYVALRDLERERRPHEGDNS